MGGSTLPTENHDQPELWETRQSLTLHFGSEAVQSRMSKDAPWRLEFEYTRRMVTFLAFHPEPADILIVGLGGGSLSKFCQRFLPNANITSIEINPAVIALRDKFLIPPDSRQFRILRADAVEYLPAHPASADIILMDAYDADGLPPALCSEDFYRASREALKPGGILSANLWRSDKAFRRNLGRLGRIFDRRVVSATCDTGNESVLCFREPALPPFAQAWKNALHYQKLTGVNLPGYLEDLVFSAGNDWFYGST
ncbi:spermidine synthase [Fluviicoccus keumensis]|uniref:Spermidine synthase n=2 Tax=Fluviicoccus keumensis TaxID=1435465 RepID=A0A4Q7YI79_9GAMM|nr:spermidine synthase [Fluviicoccus keumensis]